MDEHPAPTESETILRTKRFDVERLRWTAADGRPSERAVVRHPGAVVILPLLDDDRVCLIRNRRIAVGRTLVELPAGTLGPGEDPREAALRELAEETGYRAGSIRSLAAFYPSPGVLDERMFLFVASELVPGPTALEPGEEITSLVVSRGEALRMVAAGEIEDAKTMLGLLLWQQPGNSQMAAAREPSSSGRGQERRL